MSEIDGGGDGAGGGVARTPETAGALASAQLEAARRARLNVDAAYEAARSAMLARANGETSMVSGGGGGNPVSGGGGSSGNPVSGNGGNPFSAVTLQRGPGRQDRGRGWTVPRGRARGR